MIKEALEYVATKLAAANSFAFGQADRLERVYDKPVYYAPEPSAPPLAKTLEVATLASLAGFVKTNIDGLDFAQHVFHVESPGRVVLRSKVEDYHRRREDLIAAVYKSPVAHLEPEGAWMNLADAVILLMSSFTAQGQRDDLLAVLRSISTEKAEVREDTGLGQKVTTMAGVHVKDTGVVPNPATLAPFRAFPEIDLQPASLFIVRLRESPTGPQVLLKPADGAAWRLDAVHKVADALAFALGDGENLPAIIY